MEQSVDLFGSDRNLLTEWIRDVIHEEYGNNPIKNLILPVFANEKSKKLRPLIILYCYRLVLGENQNEELLKPLCSGIEISHNASLLVDDIFDKDELRRGKASFFVEHGTFAALSIAYNLSAFVFDLATRSGNPEIVREFGRAGTALSSALYFSRELKSNKLIDKEFFMDLLYRKTSSLFFTSARVGALLASQLGDFPESQVERLAGFGRLFGTAYQLRDDVLAIIGSKKDLGKDPNSDIANRFQSLITIEAFKLANDVDRDVLNRYYLKNENIDVNLIRSILIDSNAVNEVIKETIHTRDKALDILLSFKDNPARKKLIALTKSINFDSLIPKIVAEATNKTP